MTAGHRGSGNARATLMLGADAATLADLRCIYRGDVDVALDEDAVVPALVASQAVVQRIAQGDAAVYGINTGFGKLAQTRIAHDRLAELQRNLVLSHSAGVGAPPEIRRVFVARLPGTATPSVTAVTEAITSTGRP